MLALGTNAPLGPGLAFLKVHQRPSGLIVDPGATAPNHAWNALALLAVGELGDPPGAPDSQAIARELVAAKGLSINGDRAVIDQNSQLQAWSWIDGTFSWIEPTAWCLLALKKRRAGGAAAARISEAEAVMLDRVCDAGGWNYGNSAVLGQDLRPYVPTTALGLLAMQDRRSEPAIARGADWLATHATSERSAMALALAAIALHAYGQPIDAVLTALAEQEKRTKFLGSTHLAAMAMYARSIPERGARAFLLTGER